VYCRLCRGTSHERTSDPGANDAEKTPRLGAFEGFPHASGGSLIPRCLVAKASPYLFFTKKVSKNTHEKAPSLDRISVGLINWLLVNQRMVLGLFFIPVSAWAARRCAEGRFCAIRCDKGV